MFLTREVSGGGRVASGRFAGRKVVILKVWD